MNGTTPHLTGLDWTIIVAFIATSIGIGVVLSRRALRSVREYFTSGGSTPWWLLGTSMVATSFASDTPLTLSGWVVTHGLAQNWFWWSQVPVTMLGVFFIAALWRRANLVTDNELVHLRYSGRSAAGLRGFKALFFALLFGPLIMGWVNLSMTKIALLALPNLPRIAGVDRALLWMYLHTPLSGDLTPEARAAMRAGTLDPLRLYYDEWTMLARPGRPAVLRDLAAELRRLDYVAAQVAAAARPDASPDAAAAARLAELRAYAAGVTAGPFLERLSLAGQEAAMTRAWQALGAPAQAVPRPAALDLLNQVDTAVGGVNRLKVLLLLFLIVSGYTVISGLWGVLVTDLLQFLVATGGCIALAVLAVRRLGGLDAMLGRMAEIYSTDRARGMAAMLPTTGAGDLDLMGWPAFLVFVLFSWYTVQFTDGGSYMAQRMLAAKNERHAALGYLWYGIAHYCLRMWPWILVGFAAAVMFPYTRDALTGQYPGGAIAEEGYIKVMLAILPAGWLGLLLAAFLAAYMSTISTQLNLGASYLVNDFYRPFVRRQASERHYVRVSQFATLLITVIGLVASLFYRTISEAWFFLSTLSAGIGVIYLLRWFWWRINAWSEIVCLAALLVYALASRLWPAAFTWEQPFPLNLLYLVPYSVGTALLVTLLTPPVDRAQLVAFYRRVQPGGPGWRPIAAEVRRNTPEFRCRTPLTWRAFRGWVVSIVAVYCFLFGSQMVIVGDVLSPAGRVPRRWLGVGLALLGCLLGWFVARTFSERRWDAESTEKPPAV